MAASLVVSYEPMCVSLPPLVIIALKFFPILDIPLLFLLFPPLPKHPVTLLLASNSITGHETNVVVPKVAQYPLEIDYEVELGIIISKQCKDVDVDQSSCWRQS